MPKSPLRILIGSQKFDSALKNISSEQIARGRAIKALSIMRQEPENSGMDIERGRQALSEATGRSYNLPHPPKK